MIIEYKHGIMPLSDIQLNIWEGLIKNLYRFKGQWIIAKGVLQHSCWCCNGDFLKKWSKRVNISNETIRAVIFSDQLYFYTFLDAQAYLVFWWW